jgi:hypothetical protein
LLKASRFVIVRTAPNPNMTSRNIPTGPTF